MNEMIGRPLAVVTGASSGIGRELAAQFAENGYDLVVAAEDERIESVARKLARNGAQAIPVQAASGRVLPETAKAATQARMTEPGSGQPDRGQPDRGQPDPGQ